MNEQSLGTTERRASYMRCASIFVIFAVALAGTFNLVFAQELDGIPKGYEVGRDSISPDGRFAVLYPIQKEAMPEGESYPPNLLVRLKPYVVLAKVREDGLPTNVTASLEVQWSGDSLVAIYTFRKWGILDLSVYELEGDKVKHVHPIWAEARKIFEKDFRQRFLKKYPREADTFLFISDEGEENPRQDFEFKGRTVLLDLFADNKPNQASGPRWTASLRAIWNLDTRKLEKVDFKPGKIWVKPQNIGLR